MPTFHPILNYYCCGVANKLTVISVVESASVIGSLTNVTVTTTSKFPFGATVLPAPTTYLDKEFIGWYNTADNKYYQEGDLVRVNYGMFFEAIYK